MLILEPLYKEKIWGGSKLNDCFNYDLPNERIGECWGISGMNNDDNFILNGEFKGRRLSDVYRKHRDLFGNIDSDEFPLLIKIIDATEKLSIQVHPDDQYAKSHENLLLGKTECWIVLDEGKEANLVLGHNASDKNEMESMIDAGNWNELLNKKIVQKDDFFYIESGRLHAIQEDMLIYEIQQSSDITYRVYDYDRKVNDKSRELHLNQSLEVMNCPDHELIHKQSGKKSFERLINSEYFAVYRAQVNDRIKFCFDKPFLNISILNGEGYINDEKVSKGMHLILTSDEICFEARGSFNMVISSV